MDNTNTDRIAALKRIRSENNLTIQQIYTLLDASGDPLSMTTVKKIFSETPDNLGVSERSLRQVERVLCGIYGDKPQQNKDSLVDELRAQNEFMRDMIVEISGQMRLVLDIVQREAVRHG